LPSAGMSCDELARLHITLAVLYDRMGSESKALEHRALAQVAINELGVSKGAEAE
jgi:hypothetical protein